MLASVSRVFALVALLVAPYGAFTARAQTASAEFPLSLTDDSGTTVTFASVPQRVISLNPGLTEITFALGHGDSLVAVDSYSDYPAEAKDIQPRLNTYPSPSIETIVALKPDVVLSLAETVERKCVRAELAKVEPTR